MGKRIVPIEELKAKPDIILNKYISVPSTVHGYSVAIEYMRDWLLDKFPKDFFKTVHINGKHVDADYRKFKRNQQQIIKPAVAITPTLNTDYNREMLDLVQFGRNVWTRRSPNKNHSFFIDESKNIYLGLDFKQIEMPFNIKMRVRTRAQQLDLLDYTKLNCRIGSTQKHFLDLDCHVPYDIMLSVAMDAGFELIEDANGRYHIKNIPQFMRYLNAHSLLPFIYKMRTISGNCEFFIRIPHCYTHISCLDGISIDDGERQGSLENHFHVEFTATLKFSVPSIYAYYSMAEHRIMNKELGDINAMYQIVSVSPPDTNSKGWTQYLTTQWIDDSRVLNTIDFRELFTDESLLKVINHNNEIGLSPYMFLDVIIYNGQKEIPCYVDWNNYSIIVNKPVADEVSDIAIYADLEYINTILLNLSNADKKRLEEEKNGYTNIG